MSKVLEGMARVGWASGNPMLQRHLECFPKEEAIEIDKMRHALLWLADNVTDEMGEAFMQAWSRPWATHTEEELKRKPVVRALAAALRAAAESK